MSGYYILDGHEVVPCDDVIAWGVWIEAHKYGPRKADPEGVDACRVGSTHIGDVWVSTTFIGIDMSFGQGAPVTFETMVFGLPSQPMERYTTWEQAEAGHAAMVQAVLDATIEEAQ